MEGETGVASLLGWHRELPEVAGSVGRPQRAKKSLQTACLGLSLWPRTRCRCMCSFRGLTWFPLCVKSHDPERMSLAPKAAVAGML